MTSLISDAAGITIGSHFHPIYSLAHRRTVGLEGLLRATADGQPLEPLDAFARIPSTERHRFDLEVATAHATRFQPLAQGPNWLFLNVDTASMLRPDQAARLADTLLATGIDPQSVVLEVLEHALELDIQLIAALTTLKKAGFLVAVDDFGVGPSNLDRICELAPEFVKFDKHLLRGASTQPRIRNLLHRLVHLMHDSGALVIQEGVETETDVLLALESGCDLIQGYYPARPAEHPDRDDVITPRIDARWDELMVRDLLKRKITRRQLELARQSFVQTAISLIQNTPFDEAAKPLLSMPDAIRCFLLDSEGRQIGRNLDSLPGRKAAGKPKFAPLADTTGAVWSRRAYFQHAVDQPGVLYMSEPYLSMTDTRSCVTLSMAIEINEALHVLCADILSPHGTR
ncbi:sensor domain-containing phosphodiesterase [Paludibacterium paludis]|uniref:EAL domain-containing protein n=1 Tax=Paludibacterium paludis TaxID=1225769 RepID=A0A918UA54_9NEIS|nr:EAL domain-containing protein [Paludibacterium paludis]GGY15252.1 EAL domain-containing protein [Paludibacterium paludis]